MYQPPFVRAASLLSLAILAALSLLAPHAHAQCPTAGWLPGQQAPGTDSDVFSAKVLTNGDLVVGGEFSFAGGIESAKIARWNGTAWSPMGTGANSNVYALTLLPNGDLIAGGSFGQMGGVTNTNRVARWNGTAWFPLGVGMGGTSSVWALTTLPNGNVIAGGSFATAGGVAANNIARWNGTSWSALGAGVGGLVRAVAALPNGDIVAGGEFTTAGGAPASFIARWNGTTWTTLGTGMSGHVRALTTLANGAGGVTVNRLARWDGTAWSAFGTGVSGGTTPLVNALSTLPSGDLVIGGAFTSVSGVAANNIARWDGTAWSALTTGLTTGNTLALPVNALAPYSNGHLAAAGEFTNAGSFYVLNVARWNGADWSSCGSGINSDVLTLKRLSNGDILAGGEFYTAGGVPVGQVARWNGTAWSPLGSGISDFNSHNVRGFAELPNGDIVMVGEFSAAGGVAASRVARWDGSAWSSIGGGTNNVTYAALALPNGDIVVAGQFTSAGGVPANRIARWDGTAWSALGTGTDGRLWAVTTRANGDIVVGGRCLNAGGSPSSNFAVYSQGGVAPSISDSPDAVEVCEGDPFTLEVTATGSPAPTYQWRRNLQDIGGATASSYTVPIAAAADHAGSYDVRITNPCGNVTSSPAVVTVTSCTNCGTSDFNGDGYFGTDADIEAFFACLGGSCCAECYEGGSDFNADGDFGTDADIESFFRVLGGGPC
jgi:hypothetical protein